MAIAKTFGDLFKLKRVEKGLTLREFCRINGFDPGNVSKIERGLFQPPQSKEMLSKYAAALGIEEGSEDWLAFCDLAIISAGKIPKDIVTNEDLMNALPVLFRTVRDKTLDDEGLEKLIKSIKRELR
ncbi:MAG: helix-turn-helix transcriptional regulator [Deltaproteobacteria bacterium]|nr:helix-turn-helix transcriptional regulator [Deltaproteobacteria bacterium]